MDEDLWRFVLPGFLVTITIETCVLLVGLSSAHKIKDRLIAGVWLTACTYPIVVLVMPYLFADFSASYELYLLVAEVFAPLAECLLFAAIFHTPKTTSAARIRDLAAVVAANLASFLIGHAYHLWLA